ncbi:MAG: ATP-dependent zinc metalloprotease FtsH [Myxococcales bacterium]|nr:ATP-dependent zinc metalloprotease FtsH [Myxococcales bacterium]
MAILLVGVLLLGWMYMGSRSTAQRVRYDEFKRAVRGGEVEEISIGVEVIRGRVKTGRIAATPPAGQQVAPGTTPPPPSGRVLSIPTGAGRGPHFETVRVHEDRELIPLLESHNVRYEAIEDRQGLVLQLVFLALVVAVIMAYRSFMRRAQVQQSGVLAFGKSRGKLVGESDVKVRFADVAGVDDAKVELEEIVEFLKNPERFTRLGAKIPKGVLLVGPPGTGKTLLAKAVAGEAAVPFFNLSGSEFVEMFVGVGAARVRDLFEQAQQNAPCIVFIDELDALGRSRTGGIPGGSEEREQTLNQLLVEMDGFETNKGVIIMAATNRPEILDQALLRPGRFDRQVLVDPPDRKGREAILRVHAKDVKLDAEVDLADIAARTPGFAGADLANIINEAALLAARKDLPAVKREHIIEAIDRVGMGLEKKSRIIPEATRRRIAIHETGHAIVGEVIPGATKTARISIVPRGLGIGGYVRGMPKEDVHITTESDLKAMLAMTMAGRAAELIVYGDLSTGAANDLSQATNIARAMVTEYGMSSRLGPVSYAGRRSLFLGGEEGVSDYGANIADAVDSEVRRIVEEAAQTARELLESRRPQLENIAKVLLEKEYLDGDDLRALLEAARVPSIPPPAPLPNE